MGAEHHTFEHPEIFLERNLICLFPFLDHTDSSNIACACGFLALLIGGVSLAFGVKASVGQHTRAQTMTSIRKEEAKEHPVTAELILKTARGWTLTV